MEYSSSGILGEQEMTLEAGITRYSAKAPFRLTPTPRCFYTGAPGRSAVTAHAADDVPLAGDQLAQVMSLYGGAHFHDFADVLMPAVVPTRKVFCAHSFQSQMCTSVPQMAVL